MNKQQLQVLLSTMLGFCIDNEITTLGEFYGHYVRRGLVADGNKIVLTASATL